MDKKGAGSAAAASAKSMPRSQAQPVFTGPCGAGPMTSQVQVQGPAEAFSRAKEQMILCPKHISRCPEDTSKSPPLDAAVTTMAQWVEQLITIVDMSCSGIWDFSLTLLHQGKKVPQTICTTAAFLLPLW